MKLGHWAKVLFDPSKQDGTYRYGLFHPQMLNLNLNQTLNGYDPQYFAERVYFIKFVHSYGKEAQKWGIKHTLTVKQLLEDSYCLPQEISKNDAKRIHQMIYRAFDLLRETTQATIEMTAPFDNMDNPVNKGKGYFERLLQAQVSFNFPDPNGRPRKQTRNEKTKPRRKSIDVRKGNNRRTIEAVIKTAQSENMPLQDIAKEIGYSPKTLSNYRKHPEKAGEKFINSCKALRAELLKRY